MTAPTDAIALEIYNHLLASVAEEMGHALMRSAFSANIKERRDFSCAIFDRSGRMLAQAAHIPVHLGSAPLSVQAVLAATPLVPGEHGIVNDPFAGGTHLPDITVVSPVHLHEADPELYVASRAHHADVGGAAPGSMPLVSHIDDEGFRIPPQKLTPALEDLLAAAVRSPRERRGDLRAQVAANTTGIRRLQEVLRARGVGAFRRHTAALFAWSERLMAGVLAELPEGTWHYRDVLDGDGLGGLDIPIEVELTLRGGRARVDFSRSADQVHGPLNAVRAITLSCVHYVFRCLAPDDMPSNDGFMRLVDVCTRPGSVVDALPPAAVSAGNVETSQRIVDVLLGALAQAAPHRVPAASAGTMNNVLVGGRTPGGHDFAYYETIGGGAGGGPAGRGESGLQTHMTNTLNTPVEALEHAFPLRVERYEARRGSGGRGRHPGGDGLVRRYRFLCAAEVTLIAERRRHRPYGLAGGEPGQPGEDLLLRPGLPPEPLGGKANLEVQAGWALEVGTPGGGGFGELKDDASPAR